MKESSRKWIVAASVLIVLGALIFTGALAANGWDFKDFGRSDMITNTHELNEAFASINVKTASSDISFVPARGTGARVACLEYEEAPHKVEIINGELCIMADKDVPWYKEVVSFESPKLTVFLPEAQYKQLRVSVTSGDIDVSSGFTFESAALSLTTGDVEFSADVTGLLEITLTTGDIDIENVKAGALKLETTTGDVEIENLKCAGKLEQSVKTGDTELENVTAGELVSVGTTGDVELDKVTVEGDMNITRTTGEVTLGSSDALALKIKTTTGDVRGTLKSSKIFAVKTGTGDVNVPKSTQGGICEITTGTGDVRISYTK